MAVDLARSRSERDANDSWPRDLRSEPRWPDTMSYCTGRVGRRRGLVGEGEQAEAEESAGRRHYWHARSLPLPHPLSTHPIRQQDSRYITLASSCINLPTTVCARCILSKKFNKMIRYCIYFHNYPPPPLVYVLSTAAIFFTPQVNATLRPQPQCMQ